MFSWIKPLYRRFTGAASEKTRRASDTRLEELLHRHGKAHSEALIALAKSTSREEFIDTVSCVCLVGSAIRGGKIIDTRRSRANTSSFETFTFSQEQVAAIVRGASIEQSIFLLRKEQARRGAMQYTQFSIGRAKESDIRIVDFALSRNHACIEIRGEKFVIRDLDSRNGTCLNGIRVGADAFPLADGDTITLGRYDFTFLTPGSLYLRLRGA